MLQILDFFWKIEKQKPEQFIKLFDTESKEIKIINLKDYQFSFQLSNEQICVGYHNQGKYVPCLDRTVVKEKQNQCRYCEHLEGFKSAFFWDNEPNENMREYMQSVHEVYIALFYPDTLKVGTSVNQRIQIRTLEQDARFYIKLGNLVGTDVKKLEQYVSKTFGITEFVRSRNKLNSLTIKINSKRANKELNQIFSRIDDHQFPEHLENSLYKSIEVVDNQQFYYFPEFFQRIRVNESKILQGKFRGLRGRYIIFNNSDRDLVEDTRYIIGRYIEGESNNYEYAMPEQQSLL